MGSAEGAVVGMTVGNTVGVVGVAVGWAVGFVVGMMEGLTAHAEGKTKVNKVTITKDRILLSRRRPTHN